MFFVSVLFFSCYNDSLSSKDSQNTLFQQNPPSITWENESASEIKSYEADVEVYSMNNRKELGTTLQERYRITMKEINGKMYTRLDFDPSFSKGVARSVITDGSEVILFDTKTEKIEQRISVAGGVSQSLRFFTGDSYLSRVNLSLIKSEARKLSLDVSESSENNLLLIDLPAKLLKSGGLDHRISTRLYFDMENETLLNVEIVESSDNGTVVTTTTQPVYEENNGVPVKVGDITIIDSKAAGLIKGFDQDYPVINSPDDVPTIDKSAADALIAEGSASMMENITFGNPADLSSTETIITICKEIKLNQASDKVFKLITGGK